MGNTITIDLQRLSRPMDSEAVQAIRKLRAMPGNCPEANQLLDEALSVQLTAEGQGSSAMPAPLRCAVCGVPAVTTAIHVPVCQAHWDEYAQEASRYLPDHCRPVKSKLINLGADRLSD